MKKILSILFLTSLFTSNLSAFPVDAENIFSDKYFEVTLNEINQAKSSILVVMYLISYSSDQPDSQVGGLLKALVAAKDRGVQVKVILDQDLGFDTQDPDPARNRAAYAFLRENHAPVFFDTAGTITHAKAVVIDGETAILGSTNWSKAALTKNNETDALIRSKEFAQKLLGELAKIKLEEPLPLVETVPVSKAFVTDAGLFGQMITQADERALDVYLYMLSLPGKEGRVFALHFQNLAQSLGIESMGKDASRRQILKTLKKLKEKYKLIDFSGIPYGGDAPISLTETGGETMGIPVTYWQYGWTRRLALPAKAFYLISLSRTNGGSWSLSNEKISQSYHVGEDLVADGVRELKKAHLLDVQYSALPRPDVPVRAANRYTLLDLYDPGKLETDITKLEAVKGKEKVDRARKWAAIVYAENNLDAITALLNLEDQCGREAVEKAAAILAQKDADNPKRNLAYFIGTAKGLVA